MKVKYIADDGTEFDNEYDCAKYEALEKDTLYGVNVSFFTIVSLPTGSPKLGSYELGQDIKRIVVDNAKWILSEATLDFKIYNYNKK